MGVMEPHGLFSLNVLDVSDGSILCCFVGNVICFTSIFSVHFPGVHIKKLYRLYIFSLYIKIIFFI